jgi:hypothetical protein
MLPQTFEEAFTQIKQLVVQFQQNEQHYLSPSYNESQARNDFINKFSSRLVGMFGMRRSRILTSAMFVLS